MRSLNNKNNNNVHLKILENLGSRTFTIISASFSKNLTKTPDFLNTLFLPQNLENILVDGEQDSPELRQRALLCGSVRVLCSHSAYSVALLQGQYKFEWITTEQVITETNLCGQKIKVYYKNCNLYLSVEEVGK